MNTDEESRDIWRSVLGDGIQFGYPFTALKMFLDDIDELVQDNERLSKAAQNLLRSPIIQDAIKVAKGWDGTGEQKMPPHPFELSCKLETVCGEVYALRMYAENLARMVVQK